MHIEGGIVTFKFEQMGGVESLEKSFVQEKGHTEVVWGNNERWGTKQSEYI